MLAEWDEAGDWQRFIILRKDVSGPIMPGDSIFLLAHTQKVLDVQGSTVRANWLDYGPWQTLIVERSSLRRLTQDSTKDAMTKLKRSEHDKPVLV